MDEHQVRVTEKILEAVVGCRDGRSQVDDLENVLQSYLMSVDSTYPKALKSELNNFVSHLYMVKLQHMDEPKEDEIVLAEFNRVIFLIGTALKS